VLTSGNAFIRHDYLEVGVNPNGIFGSSKGVGAPTGWHPAGARAEIGFVADRNKDGVYGAQDGDFFYPGDELEAWGVQVVRGAAKSSAWNRPAKSDWGTPASAIPGAIDPVNATRAEVTWRATNPFDGVAISQRYSLPSNGDQVLYMDVTLKNTGASTADVYYSRLVDPDNCADVALAVANCDRTGLDATQTNFTTTQKIASQRRDGDSLSAVTATQVDTSMVALWSSHPESVAMTSMDYCVGPNDLAAMYSLSLDKTAASPASVANACWPNFTNFAGRWFNKKNETKQGDDTMVVIVKQTLAIGASATFRVGYSLSVDSLSTASSSQDGTPYTVTYSSNGSTSGSAPGTATSYAGSTHTVEANSGSLARTGYTFAGWNTQADGSGTSYSAGTGTFAMTADVALYPRWTANSYSITYSGNGNTGGSVPSPGSFTTGGTPYTVVGNTGSLVRTGYTFSGWNTAIDGSGTAYAAENTYSTLANLTLYAMWSPNSYAVTFDSQGGGVVSSGTYSTGGSVASPSDPSRTGYTFAGWFTSPSGGTALTFPYSPSGTGDITLYAQWTAKTYAIAYDGNSNSGGSVPSPGSFTTGGVNYTVESNAGSLTLDGYSFGGWNTAADGSGTTYAPGSSLTTTSDVTLYALWLTNRTVSYEGNGATSGSVPTAEVSGEGGLYTVAGNTGSLERTGYVFGGWNTAADGSGTTYLAGSGTITLAGDLTLFALWVLPEPPAPAPEPAVCAVEFDANGGAGVAPMQTVECGGSIELAAAGTMARPGHTFSQWCAAPAGAGTCYSAGDRITVSSSATLFAQWLVNGTVTYDLNGATGGSLPPVGSAVVGNSYTVAANSGSLARDGYAFVGWNTAADGSGVTFAAGIGSFTLTGDIRLYAQWVVVPPSSPGAGTYALQVGGVTRFNWGAASGVGVTYVVTRNGKQICSVVATTCVVRETIGPKSRIAVTAVSSSGGRSEPSTLAFRRSSRILVSTVYFAESSFTLRADAKRQLNLLAKVLVREGLTTLEVQGHTDAQGGRSNSIPLSTRRAKATQAYLASRIPGVAFVTVSAQGEGKPAASNSSAAGQAKNRRAEVFLR
jgi:uncharacterized repeat protein (TIGR02543 family)